MKALVQSLIETLPKLKILQEAKLMVQGPSFWERRFARFQPRMGCVKAWLRGEIAHLTITKLTAGTPVLQISRFHGLAKDDGALKYYASRHCRHDIFQWSHSNHCSPLDLRLMLRRRTVKRNWQMALLSWLRPHFFIFGHNSTTWRRKMEGFHRFPPFPASLSLCRSRRWHLSKADKVSGLAPSLHV